MGVKGSRLRMPRRACTRKPEIAGKTGKNPPAAVAWSAWAEIQVSDVGKAPRVGYGRALRMASMIKLTSAQGFAATMRIHRCPAMDVIEPVFFGSPART